MSALVGKWKFVSQDNLDTYMSTIGVPEQMRAIARESKPELDVDQDGNNFSIKTTVSDKVKESKFTIGQPFDTTSLTGQPMTSIVNMVDDKMVETQTVGDQKIVIERSIQGDNLVSQMTVNDVTAVVRFCKA